MTINLHIPIIFTTFAADFTTPMKHISFIFLFFSLFSASVSSMRAEEYSVRFYDDRDGLSHWHISQILQDTTGMIWVATWNGLNRFDGDHFVTFKPASGDAICLPNDRIRRFRLTGDNNLQCLIEDRVYLFNTRMCRFDTLPAEEERTAYEALKMRFNPDFDRPAVAKHKQYGSISLSNIWEEYTDRQGNRWLYDDHGIYIITPLVSRGRAVNDKEVRSMYRMHNGDIWVSVRDLKQVMVYDSALHLRGYLNPNGRLQQQSVSFGNMVYCMHETSDGQVLFGCKPGHVVQVRKDQVQRTKESSALELLRNAYDIKEDKNGHLWVATFGFGLWREKPSAVSHQLSEFEQIPGTEGMMIRRLLFLDDGTLLAATTQGILQMNDGMVKLHQREAGNPHSLSSNAIMCLCFFNGMLYVGTEGGGLNRLTSDIHADTWEWEHLTMEDGLESDIVFELMPWSGDQLLIQGSSSFSLLHIPTGQITNYGRSFFGKNNDSPFMLGEVPPIALNDSQVLIAPTCGLFVLDKAQLRPDETLVRIALCSIQRNGEEEYAVDHIDHIVLSPSERNLVMSFAALDYRSSGKPLYSTRLYNAGEENTPWGLPTDVNEVIIQDMQPGEYIFEIRSTNAYGHWQNNTRRIRISVQPTFMESALGKTLLSTLALLIVLTITIAFLQVRFSRKKRAETLAAYLELQERISHHPSPAARTPLPIPEILAPGYTSENERFLNALHQFMEANIANSEMTVDDLANEVGMSRSTLNRKMHELFNLTAKDFVQAARIKHACHLLRTTDLATKEVAYACGFSDPNYFSKCFKANIGMTTTEFRESNEKT